MNKHVDKKNRNQEFVQYIISKIQKDKGAAAALRRADNPNLEYQSWEYLAAFNIPVDVEHKRLPFATIAAAIAKAKIRVNGDVGLGKAIAGCYDDGKESNQAKAKLRRLLACESLSELCRVLRPLFALMNSKSKYTIDFDKLLSQLLRYHFNDQRVKSEWAQDFYGSYSQRGDK